MKRAIAMFTCLMVLASCRNMPGQNDYNGNEVGISRSVQFGKVVNVREVDVHPKPTGGGALVGGAAGLGAGSAIGKGSGNGWAMLGGAIAGAIAGGVAEQALSETKGWEYTVALQSGEVKTIVQPQNEEDVVFKDGDNVMLQYCDGGDKSRKCADNQYQRLLPVKKLPPYAKKKKKIANADVDEPEFER